MKQYEVVFSNGAQVKGTKEQIEVIAQHFGEELHFSESKNEFMTVESMNFFHLENAVIKQFNDIIIESPWQLHFFVSNNVLYKEWLKRVEAQEELGKEFNEVPPLMVDQLYQAVVKEA